MSPGSGTKHAEKFIGVGFYAWKFNMRMSLIQQDVWECVDPMKPEKYIGSTSIIKKDEIDEAKREKLAYTFIMLSLSEGVQAIVRNCVTARETWEALEENYGVKDAEDRLEIRERMRDLRMKDDESMTSYLAKFHDYLDQLKAAGGGIDDEEAIITVLKSLPAKYDALKGMLRVRGKAVTLSELKNLLLSEERQINGGRSNERDRESLYVARQKIVCFNCQKPGHVSRNCRETVALDGRLLCRICRSREHLERNCPKSRYNSTRSGLKNNYKEKRKQVMRHDENRSAEKYLFTVISEKSDIMEESAYRCEERQDEWLLDSGASTHMVKDERFMQSISEEEISRVKVADGREIDIYLSGIAEMITITNGEKKKIAMKNTLFSKEFDRNIISVSKLIENGAEVRFHYAGATVLKDGKPIIKARLLNGLYYVSARSTGTSIYSVDNIITDRSTWKGANISTWHRRLGHVSEEAVKKTIPISGNVGVCETCIKGKMDRKPFNETIEREPNLLSRVFSDVCGPMSVPTFGGSKYFVTFIDGRSRMAETYLIKQKDEVFKCFKDYKNMAENSTGKKIKCLRNDNGGEYNNIQMRDFLSANGIKAEFTAPYSSQQNGIAERFNRSIMNMVRSMMIDANAEKEFWGEAVKTATFLKNRIATKVLGWATPYDIWTNNNPKIEHLKVFGSIAYVYEPSQKRSKLDNRAKKAIMLGYDTTTKNYRLLNLEDMSIIRSRDVTFIEHPLISNTQNDDLDDKEPESRVRPTDITEDEVLEEGKVQVGSESSYDKSTESHDENGEDESSDEEIADAEKQSVMTRAGRLINLPARFKNYNFGTSIIENSQFSEPMNYSEAVSGKLKDKWVDSMNEEFKSLEKNKTWDIVDRPNGKNILGCKWVYRIKRDSNGNILKFKSRLVAKGYNQKQGIDYNRTYAPVATYSTFRCLMALSAQLKLKMIHYDFESAYLNGRLANDEEIFMTIPEGYYSDENKSQKVLRLRKCLYGLKQSGRNWNIELDEALKQSGLKRSKADPCLYTYRQRKSIILLLLYVDDMAIAYNDDEIVSNLKLRLDEKFCVKDLGKLNHFLGISVTQHEDYVVFQQKQFIQDLLNEKGMENCKPLSTPMEHSSNNCDSKLLSENTSFRSAIGSLNYLATISRPDISYSVGVLAAKVESPTHEDWLRMKRILRYLQLTKDRQICYQKENCCNVKVYSDADYAMSNDRKSTSGYITLINGGPVSWYSRKQRVTALSTMESEYVALASASQEALYIQQLLEEMGSKIDLVINVDNQSCIAYASNEKGPGRAKHISVKFHFVKDLIEQKKLELVYVETKKNAADILTKALTREKHFASLELIGLKGSNN